VTRPNRTSFDHLTDRAIVAQNLIEFLDVLQALDETVTGVNPMLRCPAGCSQCCNQQIVIGEAEWAVLLEHLHTAGDAALRRDVVARARRLTHPKFGALASMWKRPRDPDFFHRLTVKVAEPRKHPCVFLAGTGGCRVYAARPMMCRVYARAAPEPHRPMMCTILLTRLVEQDLRVSDVPLPEYMPVQERYLELGSPDQLFTALPFFALLHAAPDGDLVRAPVSIPRDGSVPYLTSREWLHGSG